MNGYGSLLFRKVILQILMPTFRRSARGLNWPVRAWKGVSSSLVIDARPVVVLVYHSRSIPFVSKLRIGTMSSVSTPGIHLFTMDIMSPWDGSRPLLSKQPLAVIYNVPNPQET